MIKYRKKPSRIENHIKDLREIILSYQTKLLQLNHKNKLNSYGKKCFSQTDEDGITSYGKKTNKTDEVKQLANNLLGKTDWMVIRKVERDVAIPDATATYRAAVITECARLEAAIAGAADVDALAVVMGAQNWPVES